MVDEESNEYIEDRDVLGQFKSNDINFVGKNRWSIILIVIFGLLFITVLTYNIGFKDHRQAFHYPNGRVKSRGNFNSAGQGIGLHTDYWEDGSIHRETNYNDKGKLHGISRLWNRKGILIFEIDHKDGKLDGHLKRWDDTGNLIRHEVYQADTMIEKIKIKAPNIML